MGRKRFRVTATAAGIGLCAGSRCVHFPASMLDESIVEARVSDGGEALVIDRVGPVEFSRACGPTVELPVEGASGAVRAFSRALARRRRGSRRVPAFALGVVSGVLLAVFGAFVVVSLTAPGPGNASVGAGVVPGVVAPPGPGAGLAPGLMDLWGSAPGAGLPGAPGGSVFGAPSAPAPASRCPPLFGDEGLDSAGETEAGEVP